TPNFARTSRGVDRMCPFQHARAQDVRARGYRDVFTPVLEGAHASRAACGDANRTAPPAVPPTTRPAVPLTKGSESTRASGHDLPALEHELVREVMQMPAQVRCADELRAAGRHAL